MLIWCSSILSVFFVGLAAELVNQLSILGLTRVPTGVAVERLVVREK